MKTLSILGSTGSIGRQTLDVTDWFADDLQIGALCANCDVELLSNQAHRYHPVLVAVADETKYKELKSLLRDTTCQVLAGREGIIAAATLDQADTVVAAISGVAGLLPVVEAIKKGKDIALANKEVLVAAGQIVIKMAQEAGVSILPVDSEHSAVFQCLGQEKGGLDSILLTASGGPFRRMSYEQMKSVKAKEALCHPTWQMGAKITIDCATLMNKGLEVIEAHMLFGVDYDRIRVVIHPQSVIHSMVQYVDGAILAQLGPADMRIPIQYALTYPQRQANPLQKIDFAQMGTLTFEKPDFDRFPCLRLAYEAGFLGKTFAAAMNAANEELVWAYLRDEINFHDIGYYIKKIMENHEPLEGSDLEEVYYVDRQSRIQVKELLDNG